ncbi:fused MFS/spermidine synthase [bacterium]|nr:fused MFS/spermidine synthase [bacterium]MBP9809071.1 fused MFS/spermidine synthase [bacterium]
MIDKSEINSSGSFALISICVLLFLSGFSALIYEVVWVRSLGLVVGNSTQATSCVLAVFLGGLSLGALIGGKLAERKNFPHLLAYGLLEISIGIAAILVTAGLNAASLWFLKTVDLFPSGSAYLVIARLLLATIFILVPTIFMGATLPILTRYFSGIHQRAAHFLTLLYGLNTLGAVLGSLAATFGTLPYLGVSGTTYFAAAVNGTVGLVACLVFANTKGGQPQGNTTAAKPEEARPAQGNIGINRQAIYCTAALTGFTALAYEVLYIRFIRFYTDSSTYSFALMVSSFLFGLAVGSWINNNFLAKVNERADGAVQQMRFLGLIQFAVAAASAIGFLCLPGILVFKAFFMMHDIQGLLFQVISAFTYMILPATLIGISFPAIGGIAASQTNEVGNAVGRVYAANTLGCIFGSALTGLVLLPLMGSQITFELIIALSVCTGFVCLLSAKQKKVKYKLFVAPALVLVLFLAMVPQNYLENSYAVLMSGKIERCEDDAGAKVLLFEKNGVRRLIVNGTFYSSTVVTAQRYMRVIGQLPVLLHANPKNVLSVCFGIGTTSGSIVKHPDVERLDIVELSPTVIKFGQYFKPTNGDVLSNPKQSVHIEDGRNYLLRKENKYDVISFEAPPPCDAGVVSLYSKEFYELCKSRLNAGGLICQWMPMETESAPLWKMMIKTMMVVFPYVTVWNPDSGEAIAIASMEPIKFDINKVQAKLDQSPQVQASLAEVGLGNAYALASTFLIGGEPMTKYFADTPVITDDHPYLEFYLPFSGKSLCAKDLDSVGSKPSDILSNKQYDLELLDKNVQAIKYMRSAAQALSIENKPDKAHSYLEKALALLPDNKFFQWAVAHPKQH